MHPEDLGCAAFGFDFLDCGFREAMCLDVQLFFEVPISEYLNQSGFPFNDSRFKKGLGADDCGIFKNVEGFYVDDIVRQSFVPGAPGATFR